MGFLEDSRKNAAGWDVPEFTFVRVLVGLPDLGQHAQGFVPAFPGLPGVHSLPYLFVSIGSTGSELHSSVGQLVHHGHSFSDMNGMVAG